MFFIAISITFGSSDTNVNIYYNLTTDNSLIIDINVSYPDSQNISEVILTMYNRLSKHMVNFLRMDLFHISDDLCAQRILQALKCSLAKCIKRVGKTTIRLMYLFPVHSIFGTWYFKLKYYNNTEHAFRTVQKELDLNHYGLKAMMKEELKLKLKIKELTADKVEVLCDSQRPLHTEPISVGFPLTKVGFGLNNMLYFGELYQRNGDPYGPKCVHPILLNLTLHEKNNIKCFDVFNVGKDKRLCATTAEDRPKPLFLFSDRQEIPNYFAGSSSFVNLTTDITYSDLPQNIIIETDIRSCFQVYSREHNENKNLCLPSFMVLEWISHLSKFVIQYESLTIWSSNQMDYQCPAGKISTILANDCLQSHNSTVENRTCNTSAGFTIYHSDTDTLHLKPVEERNECVINFILCFQNPRQRPGHVYLFPSSKTAVRPPSMFKPIQFTNLNYVLHQCAEARQEENLLELEDEILTNVSAAAMMSNILVKSSPLHCDCEEKPLSCFLNNTTPSVPSEYPVAIMTFNIKDINPNSMAYCFVDNIKSPAVNLDNLIIYNICNRKNVSKVLRDLHAPIYLAYSVSADFPLVTFTCTNRYVEKKKVVCGLRDRNSMIVTLESQFEPISRQNIMINLNHLVDKFNNISCSWNSSMQQQHHNRVPMHTIITSVMETYCSSLHSPYKIRYTNYNNTHVQCIVRSKNPACLIPPLKIEIGLVSCVGDTCMENLKTERLLIANRNSTSLDDICKVYYKKYNLQQNVLPIKLTRFQSNIANYTIEFSNISFQTYMGSRYWPGPCSLGKIIPTVVMKRYLQHVLVTTFLDTDCTKDLSFMVNISIHKLNSLIYNYGANNKIYHEIISSKKLLQTYNNIKNYKHDDTKHDDTKLQSWYDHADKAIVIPISDSFIDHLNQVYRSPVVVFISCSYGGRVQTLEIPAWMFSDKIYDYRHLRDKYRHTWPKFKVKSHQHIWLKDHTGFFVIISFPATISLTIFLLMLILFCALYRVKPLVREHQIIRNIYRCRERNSGTIKESFL